MRTLNERATLRETIFLIFSFHFQLARDVKSYTVEAEFLGSDACSQLVAAGIPVARAYSVQRQICRSD